MRTFHTGGIAGSDITSGLPRVIELFEARIPKGVSILSEISGIVKLGNVGELRIVRVSNTEKNSIVTDIAEHHRVVVKTGQRIGVGDTLTSIKKSLVSKLKNDVYNLGLSNANITKLDLAKKIKKYIKKLKIKIMINQKDPDKRDYFVSNKKIEKKGFKAKKSLDEGIVELVNIFSFNPKKYKNNY